MPAEEDSPVRNDANYLHALHPRGYSEIGIRERLLLAIDRVGKLRLPYYILPYDILRYDIGAYSVGKLRLRYDILRYDILRYDILRYDIGAYGVGKLRLPYYTILRYDIAQAVGGSLRE